MGKLHSEQVVPNSNSYGAAKLRLTSGGEAVINPEPVAGMGKLHSEQVVPNSNSYGAAKPRLTPGGEAVTNLFLIGLSWQKAKAAGI